MEHFLDVSKIEDDISLVIEFRSEYIRRIYALMYQLCIICISLVTNSIAQLGKNGLPYSNFLKQSGNFMSVRGWEKPII
jgi:hypothetical protein